MDKTNLFLAQLRHGYVPSEDMNHIDETERRIIEAKAHLMGGTVPTVKTEEDRLRAAWNARQITGLRMLRSARVRQQTASFGRFRRY